MKIRKFNISVKIGPRNPERIEMHVTEKEYDKDAFYSELTYNDREFYAFINNETDFEVCETNSNRTVITGRYRNGQWIATDEDAYYGGNFTRKGNNIYQVILSLLGLSY